MLLHNTYIYILIMAVVTYLIRTLPLTLIRKEIKNTTIKSFLYYVPYVTLAVMTFPAILESTNSVISAAIAFVIAVVLAWMVDNNIFVKGYILSCILLLCLVVLLYS